MTTSVEKDWRQCLEWLVNCRIMPARHPATQDNATALDLANALRDGVLLCHLIAFLSKRTSDPTISNDFISRPQQSQFLCMKNIRLFLSHCRSYFKLSDRDLFEPESVFEVRSFGRVLHTLSLLSKINETGVPGFPDENRNVEQDHEYYNTLEELANDGEDGFDDFGAVSSPLDRNEEKIYDSVVHGGLSSNSSSSVSFDRQSISSRRSQPPSTPREYCIQEIYETEKNYLDSLRTLIDKFQKPLSNYLSPQEIEEIFRFIDRLYRVHRSIYTDLNLAMQKQSRLRLHEVFLKHKKELLVYGEYCGHMSRAQALVEEICKNDVEKRNQIEQCLISANNIRFKLTDLLRIPMQRVLKYHLLLQNLLKLTDTNNQDRPGLSKALAEMLDLATCINEVKRDIECISRIDSIQASIVDLVMPLNTKLHEYGRLQIDGELRIARANDTKARPRHVFLFDRIILLCKVKGDNYSYKDSQEVKKTKIEEGITELSSTSQPVHQLIARRNEKWAANVFQIISWNRRSVIYTMYAKTDALRKRWIAAFNLAIENNSPPGYKDNGHVFEMHTFREPTECGVCQRLLKGSFLQGYFCKNSQLAVHKECIQSAPPCLAIPPAPPPRSTVSSSGAVSPSPNCHTPNSPTGSVQPPLPPRTSAHSRQSSTSNNFTAICIADFRGPGPTPSKSPLPMATQESVLVLDSLDLEWWYGRNASGQDGWFLARCVQVRDSVHSRSSSGTGRDSLLSHASSVPSREGSYVVMPDGSGPNSGDRASISSTSSNHSLSRMASVTAEDADFLQEPWYVGPMSRQEASNRLRRSELNTFLVRRSQNRDRAGEFSISLNDGSCVRHLRIERNGDQPPYRYYLSDARSFESIEALVRFYSEHSLAECFNMLNVKLMRPINAATTPTPLASSVSPLAGAQSVAPARPTRRQQRVLSYAVAIYDFMATQPSQLSLKQGDRVAIFDKIGGDLGWWRGRCGDRSGFFPVAYVREEEVMTEDNGRSEA